MFLFYTFEITVFQNGLSRKAKLSNCFRNVLIFLSKIHDLLFICIT